MKLKIQKIFTKIRNELNNREDELLLKNDEKFNNAVIQEDNVKKFEKLSKQINKLLEEINSIDKEWDIENLNYFLNYCANIEININNITKDIESLQKCICSKIYNIDYSPKDLEINEILEKIKNLGNMYNEFEFENSQKKLIEELEYILNLYQIFL